MAVYYDDTADSFAISPEECPDCGEPRYDTGCDAPGCSGVAFPCCGTGCDAPGCSGVAFPCCGTGCDAPGCSGVAFPCCGTGCDIDVAGDGRCGTALAEEDDDEYGERVDRERAAFGLPPITGEEAGS